MKNFGSQYGACVIYQKSTRNTYYMMAYKEETAQYLTMFVEYLKLNKEFKSEDLMPLIDRLKSFIESINP